MQVHRAQGLDVLVLESTPGAGRQEVDALVAAGHRVHTCHDPAEPGFPCRALADGGTCPLDEGVDVGLLVRRGVAPRPTEHEQGVGCLLRARIPLVEQGSEILDPYRRFLSGRVHGDVPSAVESAADHADDPLRAAIADRIDRLMGVAGHRSGDVRITFLRSGADLRIRMSGPAIPEATRQAVGVRVLDAVRSVGRTYGRVDVEYSAAN
jgi:hypothetical protein